jgi:Gram-negative bacterial TonB protein C-terminal
MKTRTNRVHSLALLLLTPLFLFSQHEELLNAGPPPLDTLHFPVWPGCYDPALSEQELLRCTRECLATLIYANLEWPAEKLADSGYVKIKIHVNADGTLYDFSVIEGLNPFVDNAVLRACNKVIPDENWRPAYIHGQPMSTEFAVWVKYNPDVAGDNVLLLRQLGESVYKEHPKPSWDCILIVEHMPSFPGEANALWKFILDNLELPPIDDLSFQGSQVVVQFVVEEDGRITNPTIMKSIHPDIDAAYLKLVSKMPNWIPGRQRGRSVRTQMNLPIRIRIE